MSFRRTLRRLERLLAPQPQRSAFWSWLCGCAQREDLTEDDLARLAEWEAAAGQPRHDPIEARLAMEEAKADEYQRRTQRETTPNEV